MKYFNETYTKRKFMTRNEWSDTYRAIHAETEEKVILKVLVRKSNDERYVNSLRKEVEILKNIKNPNLINVNNMFKYSGCGKVYYYLEGEYFKGISLEEKLSNGKIEEDEALRIIESVAEGLKELHSRNILFGNLNLSNIFINSKDVVKTDILSHLENKEFVILSDDDKEKVEEEKFNPQKDIKDLGIILYSLLTGKLNFESDNYKKEISNENLVSIIEKSTNDTVKDKYGNINRLMLDLKSYNQNGQLSDESYDVEEVTIPKKKRKKVKIGKAIGVCASIVMIGGVAVYGYDLIEKNKQDDKINNTKVEETTKPTEENKTTTSDKKDDKPKDKDSSTSNSDKDKDSSNSESNKNDSSTNNSSNSKPNNNSSSNNNSSNSKPNNNGSNNDNSSNNKPNSNNSGNNNSNNNSSDDNSNENNSSKPDKPSKPDNDNNSSDTIKPDEDNNNGGQTPEITPPPQENDSSTGNTPPEENEIKTEV